MKPSITTEYHNVQEQTHAPSGVSGGACDPRTDRPCQAGRARRRAWFIMTLP